MTRTIAGLRHAVPALLLAGCLLCVFPARAVQEAAALPYAAETVPGTEALSPAVRSLVPLLYAAAAAHEERAALPAGTAYDDADAAMRVLLTQYPELCALEPSWGISYYTDSPETATAVTLRYTCAAAEAYARAASLLARARLLAYEARIRAGGSDYDTALFLHDALCDAAAYGEGADSRSAAGALLDGTAVCEGYAGAYALLLRLAGIPCAVVTGTAVNDQGRPEGHAWNVAVLGGQKCVIDVTWDDQPGGAVRDFFGLSAAQAARDRTPDAGSVSPDDGGALDWYRRAGRAADTPEEAYALFDRLLPELAAGEEVRIRLAGADDCAAFLAAWSSRVEAFNKRAGAAGLYGTFTVTANDRQYCVGIRLCPNE